ncbi:hypothetical protein ACFV7Q_00690 [Streptomyces sp. NPDC059851]|uniref:hypothetical protein n=1 Tax=Streptomyces sp. NPDC059851 TaxID=3346971 RepID=UPI003669705F
MCYEFRAAKELAAKDVLDWVIEIGGQILLDELGYTDAKKCFTRRDVESCLWTLVNVVMVGVAVAEIPAVTKVIYKVGKGVHTFLEGLDRARRTPWTGRASSWRPSRRASPRSIASSLRWGGAPQKVAPRNAVSAATPKICVRSAIGTSGFFYKVMMKSAKNEQVALDFKALEARLAAGNKQAGIGASGLSGGIEYTRSRNGGRMFFRRVGDAHEIVAMCDKKHEPAVIKELQEIYA